MNLSTITLNRDFYNSVMNTVPDLSAVKIEGVNTDYFLSIFFTLYKHHMQLKKSAEVNPNAVDLKRDLPGEFTFLPATQQDTEKTNHWRLQQQHETITGLNFQLLA